MKCLIKPKFNNCILIETQYGHNKDKSKSATEICWYRFQGETYWYAKKEFLIIEKKDN